MDSDAGSREFGLQGMQCCATGTDDLGDGIALEGHDAEVRRVVTDGLPRAGQLFLHQFKYL
eukprot:scaffold4372_cov397-Prasinococcus_capsulatus_cf.AAC.49